MLSIARYWIGSSGNTLPRLESWQLMHTLPYREAITEDVYGKLFKDVGRREEGVQCYFSARAARLGFNKDGDGLNITNESGNASFDHLRWL